MRSLTPAILGLFFLLQCPYLLAQSLIQDAKLLSQLTADYRHLVREQQRMESTLLELKAVTAADTIQHKKKLKIKKDAQQIARRLTQSSAEILAILDHYQQWSAAPSIDNVKLMADRTLSAYRGNQDLAPVLARFRPIEDARQQAFFKESYLQARNKLKSSGEREKILNLLTSTYPQSPREYLSVRKTLRDYQEPPLSNLKALESATKETNRNINQGLPNERELIIGLFTFLMERAQEEVIINFLERLLGRNGIQQFKELFPSTSTAFQDLSFNFSDSFVQRLRQAFYEDIQLLGVSLPSLLSNPEYFQLLETDPIAYNFLQLYTMVAMGQQGVPISEIIPFTFRNLFERYQDEKKKMNLNIARFTQQYDGYSELVTTAHDAVYSLVRVGVTLDQIQSDLLNSFVVLEGSNLKIQTVDGVPNLTSINSTNTPDSVKNALVTLLTQAASATDNASKVAVFIDTLVYDLATPSLDSFIKAVQIRHGDALELEKINENTISLIGEIDKIDSVALETFKAKLSIKMALDPIPLADTSYQGLLQILRPDEGYSLKLLPSLLQGKLDTAIVKSWSSLKSYDQFLRSPLNEEQMRGAGLALARRLNGPWHEDRNVVAMLRKWQHDILNYRNLYIQKKDEMFPELKLAKEEAEYNQAKTKLNALIAALLAHYKPASDSHEALSLGVLQRALNDNIFDGELATTRPDKIAMGQKEISQIEERILEVESDLYAQNSGAALPSPIVAYFDSKKEFDPLQATLLTIDSIAETLSKLQGQLDAMDEQLVSEELKAVENISPMVQMTEVLSHLMYCLKTDGPGWLKREQLNEVLLDRRTAPVFLGLLGQQLKQANVQGRFAVSALTSFIRLSLEELSYAQKVEFTRDSINMSFFKKAAFVNMTLNRLLEMPLFVNQDRPNQTESLLDLHPDLGPVPVLSDMALEFIYYTNIRDHRHAVTSFIRLLTEIMQVTDDRAKARAAKLAANPALKAKLPEEVKPYKPSKALAFMKKYGYFMADLIDADSSAQVKALLEGIADPPGSSRVKRREPFTANINGYVGILAGSETLRNIPDPNRTRQSYATFAPTLPVGISLSRLVGKGPKPESFSLFLSVLDLGSLTTYSLSDDVTGENQISFKNILKPGVQLHWNIQNSPFFLGVGAQTGPRFREFNGEQKAVQATTLFFNMGIDVVIKRLY